jgi:PAS domain S-box-containing protein
MRQAMLSAMAESEEKLRGLFELSPIGIARNAMDGRFIEFNEAFRAITGYPSDELKAIDYWKLTPEKYKDAEFSQIESLKAHGYYGPYEKEYIRKDGSLVPLSLRGMLVSGRDGNSYIWSLVEDITERKLARESRAKSEFLMMMSHELRTPLNAILGFAEMITLSQPGDGSAAKVQDFATSIHAAGSHLLDIINDILDISAVEAGKLALHPEEVDLVRLVETAGKLIEPRAKEQNQTFEVSIAEIPTAGFKSDRQRLKQILINLLGNAVKFTPEGGAIRLRVNGTADGGVSFAVSDTGIGMSAEDIAKALSLFGQVDSHLARKYQGTGLGLPLCLKLAEALGGTLEIKSAPGRGTAVTVTLPPAAA